MTAVFKAGTLLLGSCIDGGIQYIIAVLRQERTKEVIYGKTKLRHAMPTQGEILQKKLKEWYKEFGKTPYAIPVIVALSCLVFYASVAYLGGACLSNMLAPLFMLGMLWSVNVRRVRHLLVIGAVATVFFSAILAVFLVTSLQHVEPQNALSEDGETLVGTLSPLYGGPDTTFSFNLTVALTNNTTTVDNANVIIFKLGQSGGKEFNYSMVSTDSYTENVSGTMTWYYNYTYVTVIATPINQFLFRANVSGEWIQAGKYNDLGDVYFLQGPVYKDSWAVASPILPNAYEYGFIYVFGPYAIVLGMIWWTRRARRMRQKQLEKWEQEHAKADEEKPKEVSKVPSLATAMGKEDDSFVCSECGADVPADAQVCPKCGEKFE
jgi:ribosomal protein L40E